MPDASLPLRHALATLAYRAAKALRDTPPAFEAFRAGETSRAAGEILAHMGDLMDWATSQARGEERWQPVPPRSWREDTDRFFAALTSFDEQLASGKPLATSTERMFQGAVADALTHVGQITLLRRLAGAPVRGENYSKASIEVGRTGPEQSPPKREFD